MQLSQQEVSSIIWGFPKIMGTFLGVPIIRIIVYWGLYWGPLILGNYHMLGYYGTRMEQDYILLLGHSILCKQCNLTGFNHQLTLLR